MIYICMETGMAGLPLTEIRKTGRGAGFWREIRSSVWDVKFGASVRHPGVSGRQLHVGGRKFLKRIRLERRGKLHLQFVVLKRGSGKA